ncbi:BamA/TamA family outer membrane protein, partial [Fibrobacterales bacterium]|nr:BamA/TamA family outer membrane protein [Fibrobacterales bacterium]
GLSLFSEVTYANPSKGVLEINVRQLPSWLALPSSKKTDQDGLIIGPGLVFFDLFGLDYRYDFYARSSINPLFRSNEILTFLESPWLGGLPIDNSIAFMHIRSFNSLKLYDETSFNTFAQGCYRLVSSDLSESWCMGGRLEYLAVKRVDSSRIFPHFSDRSEQWKGYEHTAKVGLYGWVDTRDRKLDPHWGSYTEMLGSKAGGGSTSADYWELIFDHRFWYELLPRTVFHGSLLDRHRLGSVPRYEYYHAGGANSLRGFLPDTARWAPEEILATAEVRYDIIPRKATSFWGANGVFGLQGVVGYDYLIHHNSFNNLKTYSSIYTGAHLLLAGLDRIRLEIGYNPENEGPVFTLGFFEKSTTQRPSVR